MATTGHAGGSSVSASPVTSFASRRGGGGWRSPPQRRQPRSRSRRGPWFSSIAPIHVARTVLVLLACCYLCGLYGQLHWTHRGDDERSGASGEGHYGVRRHLDLERALGDAFHFHFAGGVDGEVSGESKSKSASSDEDEDEDDPPSWRGLHGGRVLPEFLDRALSRRIAQSDVLVVAPDVSSTSISVSGAASGSGMGSGRHGDAGPGGTVISRAAGEGHAVHAFPPSVNLTDHYWGRDGDDRGGGQRPRPPGWILLAYLIPDTNDPRSSAGRGIDDVLHPSRFDALLSHSTMTYVVFQVGSVYNLPTRSVGDVSGRVAIQTLLKHKYKVQIMAVTHHASRRAGAGAGNGAGLGGGYYGPNDLLTSAEELEDFLAAGAMAAGEAAEAWRREGAALDEDGGGGGNGNGEGGERGDEVRFGAYLFATQGLDLAIPSRSAHLDLEASMRRDERRRNGNDEQKKFYETFGGEGEGRREGGVGEDGAPPPPLVGCPRRHEGVHLDFVDGVEEGHGEEAPLLRLLVGETSILYTADEAGAAATAGHVSPADGYQTLTIGGGDGGGAGVTYTMRELWLSRPDDPSSSEAACVRVSRTRQPTDGDDSSKEKEGVEDVTSGTAGDVVVDRRPMVSCATRVLRPRGEGRRPWPPPNPTAPLLNVGEDEDKDKGKHKDKPTANLPPPPATLKRYNVLSILIDPISRSHFRRSLPKTSKLLSELDFASFDKYTVVGGNSGPNQAALFSGVPLSGGREGISSSLSHSPTTTTGTGTKRWIWDQLRDDGGYATLKLEDGCVLNSNMVQSLRPNTTHGEQLQGLFCFDYDRPNCVGGELAAGRALRYAERFMDAYSSSPSASGDDAEVIGGGQQQGRQRQPWAAFLSFIDSHEDSMAVAGVLDDELHGFLSGKVVSDAFEDTLVLVLSDHGLHYGPYFQTPQGERERAQPILYVRLPDDLTRSSHPSATAETGGGAATVAVAAAALRLNAAEDMWVTPFDVHETVLDVTLGMADRDGSGVGGGFTGVAGGGGTTTGGVGGTTTTAMTIGSTLLRPLPDARRTCHGTPGVPVEYCRLLDDGGEGGGRGGGGGDGGGDGGGGGIETSTSSKARQCTLPPRPPSVMSYYSDVPREHRPPLRPDCAKTAVLGPPLRPASGGKNCSCSTNGSDWHPCGTDDVGNGGGGDYSSAPSGPPYPFLRLVSCEEEKGVRTNIDFEPRPKELVDRYVSRRQHEKERVGPSTSFASGPRRPPNILLVNIDSVFPGDAAAERHLPRTLRLLRRHGIVRGRRVDDEGAGGDAAAPAPLRCPTGFCAARFAKSASSSASPLASSTGLPTVLTGCVERASSESPNLHTAWELGGADRKFWCPPSGRDANGTVGGGGSSLFDIAGERGYVTFHAEDFCGDAMMDASPTDYTLGNAVFCRVEERATANSVPQNVARRCMDGRSRHRIAFESISKMWDAYTDTPLFTFLNTRPLDYRDAGASLDSWADLVHGFETYDKELSSFLEGMLARGGDDDAGSSIIVLHSSADHVTTGMASFDYSFQVERLTPFTAIIVPVNFSGLSISALAENERGRGRLVTDFDLHHTLERLIRFSSNTNTRTVIPSKVAQRVRRESDLLRGAYADMEGDEGVGIGTGGGAYKQDDSSSLPPLWSTYDLLKSRIPPERTCSDAGMPSSSCPCVHEMGDV